MDHFDGAADFRFDFTFGFHSDAEGRKNAAHRAGGASYSKEVL
jgi:hypothetical protein